RSTQEFLRSQRSQRVESIPRHMGSQTLPRGETKRLTLRQQGAYRADIARFPGRGGSMKSRIHLAAGVLTFLMAGLWVAAQSAQVKDFRPITDQQLRNPDPGDWVNWRRTLNGWGYSPLDQINRQNVGQ